MIHDAYCLGKITANPNMLVPFWIMAAWAYDVADDPIISDAVFDRIARELDEKWDVITHWHKRLLDRSALKSALAIRGNYPGIAIDAAQSLQRAKKTPPPVTLNLFGDGP